MIIEKNTRTKGYTAFQRMPECSRKAGFICDAETIGQAIAGVVDLVARHCATTGIHPAEIITQGVQQR